MDVSVDRARQSGACYLCAKRGHIARNCPERSMQIHATLESMSADDREAWAEELGQLAASPAGEDGQDATDGTYEEGTADSTPQDFI